MLPADRASETTGRPLPQQSEHKASYRTQISVCYEAVMMNV